MRPIYGVMTPVVIAAFLIFPAFLTAQEDNYTDYDELTQYQQAWGLDVLLSESGVGLGGFYLRQFTPTISGFIALSISESKDNREREFIDFWTGRRIVYGKVSRFIVIPLQVGTQYRLFKDQIMDNLRPYVTAAIGPTMIYTTPYRHDFFSDMTRGKPYYTIGGYVGAGAYIGGESSNLFALNFRYYFVPYWGGLRSMVDPEAPQEDAFLKKDQFGGFFITFTFGIQR